MADGRKHSRRPGSCKASALALAVVLGLGAMPGCGAAGLGGKWFWVKRYPAFYTPEIKTVAVLPFENTVPDGRAGGAFAEYVAAALRANGAYTVVPPSDVVAMAGPARPAGATLLFTRPSLPNRDDMASALKSSGTVQAYIVGTVLDYGVSVGETPDWTYAPCDPSSHNRPAGLRPRLYQEG